MKHALGLKLGSKQSLEDFVEVASETYAEAGFTDKQKIVFLSKSALVYQHIQSFGVQRALSSF